MDGIEWNDPTDFPDLRDGFESSLSEDVLIYVPDSRYHQIGWFNFKTMEWVFLCNECGITNFVWRRFNDKYDRKL